MNDFNTELLPPELLAPEAPMEQWDIPLLRTFKHIDSTNVWLQKNAEFLPLNTVIVAAQQSQGKGRFDRTWISPPGKNLYFSILTRPHTQTINWPQATQIAGIELAQMLSSWGFELQVKWPNDLLHNHHKICGILAEKWNSPSGGALILGIGININITASELQSIAKPATSLREICGHRLNREYILKCLLQRLEKAWEKYESQALQPWLDTWRKMTNFVGSPARLVQNDTAQEGVIQGIADDGSLLFKTAAEGGEEVALRVYAGDLELGSSSGSAGAMHRQTAIK